MVKRSVDQKLRLRIFDARHRRIETGAVIKNRKHMNGVEGGKGTCYQWKEKGQCSKGDQCSFHESSDRAKPTPKAEPPSGPPSSKTQGRSESRTRDARGRSQSEKFNRPPCKYFLTGTCTRSTCEYWHPPECRFYKTETGYKAWDKCLFPHHKVHDQLNKKPQKAQTKRKRDDKNAVAIVKNVLRLARLGIIGSQRGKQSRGNPMQKVLGSIRRVRFTQSTLRQASIRETKDHRLEKYKSNFLISEVPTF